MGFGLEEYKDTDRALQSSSIYRFLLTIGFTAAFYRIARRNNVFMQSNQLTLATGVFGALSFYYARGFGLHLAALNANCNKHSRIRNHQLEKYSMDHNKSFN